MVILVTGGCGFIGSNLVRQALAQGLEVVNVDALSYAGNPRSLSDVESDPRYRFEHMDVRDAAALGRVLARERPEALIHLAAETHVDRSITGPMPFVGTNVVGTCTLLEATQSHWESLDGAARAGFRFVHVSTDEVYGSLGDDDSPFTEESRYDPRSPYSASKASSDHFVRAWRETYGLPTIVTNCSNNYGPYQYPEKLIPVAILSCLSGDPIPVYGEGANVRDWLYVGDHVDALLTVLRAGVPGRTYNIGAQNEVRNIDLVEAICDLVDEMRPRDDGRSHRSQIAFVTDRLGHDRRYALSAARIRQELGWAPVHDWRTALRHTVQWYLENEPWWRDILNRAAAEGSLGSSTGPAR